MGFGQAPASYDDLISVAPLWGTAFVDDAGEVNATHHRKVADHFASAGDGEPILVVEAGVTNIDGDIALGQVGIGELSDCSRCGGFCHYNGGIRFTHSK